MNYVEKINNMINTDNAVFFIIIVVIMLCLMVPVARSSFLTMFDQPFVNLMIILTIIIVQKQNQSIALLMTILYILCIIQKRKILSRVSVADRIKSIQITSDVKVNAVKDIIRENDVSDEEKKDLISKILDSNTSNNNKLRVDF